MSTSEAIRVAIIEDDRMTREGLNVLINGSPGYRCVSTFRSVKEALRFIGSESPDVLLDIHLPGMLGSEGARLLKERFPTLQILMLTVYEEEEKVFESLCNGACGYLLKKTPPVKLLEAIQDAYQGGSPMTPEIARKLVRLFQKTGPPEDIAHHLTPHEVRVLELLSRGFTYQAAADHLKVSISTIRKYICSIYDKLHVHTKSDAVRKALKSGIIY
jgi:DNA-binding NarL/FixJ family response regulator